MKAKKSTYTFEEARSLMERYCAYQERSQLEVNRKLADLGMIREINERIELHLYQHDFLNEERFSRAFARGKFRIKKWGRVRIIRELKLHGVSDRNVQLGLSEIDDEEYENTMHDLLEKKYIEVKDPHIYRKRKKVCDFMLRRGFESERVYAIIRDLESKNNI